MASNLTKRLDRLERIIRERAQLDAPPVYVSAGDNVPEGAIVIERVLVGPPKREEAQLPFVEELTGKDVFGGEEKPRREERRLLEYPSRLSGDFRQRFLGNQNNFQHEIDC